MIRLIVFLLAGLVVLASTSEQIFGQYAAAQTLGETAEELPVIATGTSRADVEIAQTQSTALAVAFSKPSPSDYIGLLASDTFVPFDFPMVVDGQGRLADAQ